MKKLLFLMLLLVLGVGIGYLTSRVFPEAVLDQQARPKKAILRVALVADSHNDNDLLAKALSQAQGVGVNFVIGLGDYSNVGTIDELKAAKDVFESSGLRYYVIDGDHDLWASRNAGGEATKNFVEVFGEPGGEFEVAGVKFVLMDNADIYRGIASEEWQKLRTGLNPAVRKPLQGLTLVFAHKTPYHPQSAHIMGEQTPAVAEQAKQFMDLMEERRADGFFSGDLHFFAKYNSPGGFVKMTTIGAVSRQPNPQGPRFGVLTIWEDYSWDIEDVEIL